MALVLDVENNALASKSSPMELMDSLVLESTGQQVELQQLYQGKLDLRQVFGSIHAALVAIIQAANASRLEAMEERDELDLRFGELGDRVDAVEEECSRAAAAADFCCEKLGARFCIQYTEPEPLESDEEEFPMLRMTVAEADSESNSSEEELQAAHHPRKSQSQKRESVKKADRRESKADRRESKADRRESKADRRESKAQKPSQKEVAARRPEECRQESEVASSVVEMADAHIAELQEQKEALPANSQAAQELKEEIVALTQRRKSAAILVKQLESGTPAPKLEQQIASEAVEETEKQIEALQQESAALPADSNAQEAIAEKIEQLQETKDSAEEMLARAEESVKKQEVAARRQETEVASTVVEMADAHIAELQEQKEALPANSQAAQELKEEIVALTQRRKSAAILVEQLESGTAAPELEQQIASEAVEETEKQIEALQQESAALPANSNAQEAIAEKIEQLQVTKDSAEEMLAKAEATVKIEALQQESAALPANSDAQEAIAEKIEQLQATKDSAEEMLAKAEATMEKRQPSNSSNSPQKKEEVQEKRHPSNSSNRSQSPKAPKRESVKKQEEVAQGKKRETVKKQEQTKQRQSTKKAENFRSTGSAPGSDRVGSAHSTVHSGSSAGGSRPGTKEDHAWKEMRGRRASTRVDRVSLAPRQTRMSRGGHSFLRTARKTRGAKSTMKKSAYNAKPMTIGFEIVQEVVAPPPEPEKKESQGDTSVISPALEDRLKLLQGKIEELELASNLQKKKLKDDASAALKMQDVDDAITAERGKTGRMIKSKLEPVMTELQEMRDLQAKKLSAIADETSEDALVEAPPDWHPGMEWPASMGSPPPGWKVGDPWPQGLTQGAIKKADATAETMSEVHALVDALSIRLDSAEQEGSTMRVEIRNIREQLNETKQAEVGLGTTFQSFQDSLTLDLGALKEEIRGELGELALSMQSTQSGGGKWVTDTTMAENDADMIMSLRSDLNDETRARQETHKNTSRKIELQEYQLRSYKDSLDALWWRLSKKGVVDVQDGLESGIKQALAEKASAMEVAKLQSDSNRLGKTVQQLVQKTRKMQEQWEDAPDCVVGVKCLSCSHGADQMRVAGALELLASDRAEVLMRTKERVLRPLCTSTEPLPPCGSEGVAYEFNDTRKEGNAAMSRTWNTRSLPSLPTKGSQNSKQKDAKKLRALLDGGQRGAANADKAVS